jgi:TRAP-type uncharacterized transport system substrate-binding protein
MRRRTTSLAGIALATALAVSACGGQQDRAAAGAGADESSCDAGSGRVNIATGNSTGVYFVVGGGLAQVINKETDLQATAAETGASVQNIQQLADGDYDIGFSLADTASDAVKGENSFDSPQDVSSLGRIYSNYTQVVVQANSGIDSVEDFKGKRISTGSPESGTEVMANRMIEAAGLTSGGLPTPALTDLFTSKGNKVKFIDVTPLLPELKKVNEVYEEASIPADTYGTPEDIPSIAVPNVLMVRNDMKENVACAMTTLMLENKDDLVQVHPAAEELDPQTAGETGPIPLHPGSERALEELNK